MECLAEVHDCVHDHRITDVPTLVPVGGSHDDIT